MVLRQLALDLYRLEKEVAELTRKLAEVQTAEERMELEKRLRAATAERNELRGRLEAKKEPPTYRTTFR